MSRVPSPDLASEARSAGRLGILGGSFDPPHRCHLEIARRAREAFALDHVLFVPARVPPHKLDRQLADDRDRVHMLELLLEPEPTERMSVWTGELLRDGPSYSVDTLLELNQHTTADLFWILGSDNLPGLPKWSRVEEFLALARPIVHYRVGDDLQLESMGSLSNAARQRLREGYLELEPCPASSTLVRSAIGLGRPIDDWVPPTLIQYIRAKGLYARS